eukprot:429773_1
MLYKLFTPSGLLFYISLFIIFVTIIGNLAFFVVVEKYWFFINMIFIAALFGVIWCKESQEHTRHLCLKLLKIHQYVFIFLMMFYVGYKCYIGASEDEIVTGLSLIFLL